MCALNIEQILYAMWVAEEVHASISLVVWTTREIEVAAAIVEKVLGQPPWTEYATTLWGRERVLALSPVGATMEIRFETFSEAFNKRCGRGSRPSEVQLLRPMFLIEREDKSIPRILARQITEIETVPNTDPCVDCASRIRCLLTQRRPLAYQYMVPVQRPSVINLWRPKVAIRWLKCFEFLAKGVHK